MWPITKTLVGFGCRVELAESLGSPQQRKPAVVRQVGRTSRPAVSWVRASPTSEDRFCKLENDSMTKHVAGRENTRVCEDDTFEVIHIRVVISSVADDVKRESDSHTKDSVSPYDI
ncbi:hypothetical protein EVAR_188_1 [Eumeta japonica]|uniref:Uncharacterized protein n=1 Tax=Eumeta variegata TaxID=151549 RepID=A0A4C1S8S0_EUMVA|nr:hypothetical protein EVAR_188_1 [Eumeta japonica]